MRRAAGVLNASRRGETPPQRLLVLSFARPADALVWAIPD